MAPISDTVAFGNLRALFDAAVTRARPENTLPPFLEPIFEDPPEGRIVVVGAGKASAAMARVLETHCPKSLRPRLSGLVVTRYGHAVECDQVEIVEAAHPVPDGSGLSAARRIRDLVQPLGVNDLVVALISGGGSALLTLPGEGLNLRIKQDINAALLRSGAAIDAMNCVRKHLSQIKGGNLARAAFPARLVTLAISDVPGDDPSVIASGPTVPDRTTQADATAIFEQFGIAVPYAAAAYLSDPANETPKPGDPVFINTAYHLIATPKASLDAAAAEAARFGYEAVSLGDTLEGEARELGAAHADLALNKRASGMPRPCVLLSGGETTVTVSGKAGKGGRNAEYLLGFALAVGGRDGIHAIACDTDGIDGSEDNAGAVYGPKSLAAMRDALLDPALALTGHDAYSAFEAANGLVVTGPTHTNVNDFRAILISA